MGDPRNILLLAMLGGLVACAGCQTGALGGTMWRVVDVVEPDASDRAELEPIESMLVYFSKDGRIITTTLMKDGSAELRTNERYSVRNDVIEVESPDGDFAALFRMEGDNLRIHSEQFVLVMRPVKRVEP